MANKYCNLDGSKKIKDEYKKINVGFDKVEVDINNIDTRVNNIITTPAEGVSAQEIIDARKGKPTLGAKIDEMDNDLAAHKADYETLKNRLIPVNILNRYPTDITNGLKIKTNIPENAGTVLALNIVGYKYNYTITDAYPVNIIIGGLMLANGYRSEKASSINGFKPEIKLAVENGKLVIWLNITNFQLYFFINAAKGINYNPSWYEGWDYVDESLSENATRVAIVPYV